MPWLRRLSPAAWTLLLLLLAGLLWTRAVHADVLGAVRPGCVPAYLTMDPDYGPTWRVSVRVIEPDRRVRWGEEYVLPSEPCCRWLRNALTDLARHVQDKTAAIQIVGC